jgi:hypothetical protein
MQVYKPHESHSQNSLFPPHHHQTTFNKSIHSSTPQPDHLTISPPSPSHTYLCTMRRGQRRALRIVINTAVETDPLLSSNSDSLPSSSASSYLTARSPSTRSEFARSYTSLASLGAEPPSRFSTCVRIAKLKIESAWERVIRFCHGEL